ncbi:hypothetical protein XENOCAPTIV_009291 [Xenoophorus captivus]|uniref:Uncharacterized protein n=1 Tax=Xenoophorus captivus TaxID=1517983 RepID=A0ABV0RQ31_9TELE
MWSVDPQAYETYKKSDKKGDKTKKNMYNFTNFAVALNELEPGMEAVLAPTDSRFRPDIRAMESGNIDEASKEKERLEEKQRAARKERAKQEEDWTTR